MRGHQFVAISLLFFIPPSVNASENGRFITAQYPAQHWVMLDSDGALNGSILSDQGTRDRQVAGGVQVVLIPLHDASPRTCLRADTRGAFRFKQVQPGLYAIVAFGTQGLAAHTIHVIPADDTTAASKPTDVDSGLTIVMTSSDRDVTKRLIRSYSSATAPSPAKKTYILSESSAIAVSMPADRRFHLTAEGNMAGRLHMPQSKGSQQIAWDTVNVLLVQANEIVARTMVDSQGRFSLSDLQPGHYGIVAAGSAGFAAFGLELLPFDATQQEATRKPKVKLTASANRATQPSACCAELCCQVCPPRVVDVIHSCIEHEQIVTEEVCGCCQAEEVIVEEEIIGEEVLGEEAMADAGMNNAAGGFGSGGGGGGGGGSGGGLGGAGALAGLGAAAALAASGGGGSGNAVVASPATP